MEQLGIIISICYVVFSLLASAVYYNAVTGHTFNQKALNHLLIWALPFVWALHLKRTSTGMQNTFDQRGGYASDFAHWGIGGDRADVRFAENAFECAQTSFETGSEE